MKLNGMNARPGLGALGLLRCRGPPFPYDRKAIEEPVGLPVIFDGQLSRQDQESLYYGEVGLHNGQLVTSGQYGWTMVAAGVSSSIEAARARAVNLADKIIVPNVRYRRDIGIALIERDFALVEKLGLLNPRGTADTIPTAKEVNDLARAARAKSSGTRLSAIFSWFDNAPCLERFQNQRTACWKLVIAVRPQSPLSREGCVLGVTHGDCCYRKCRDREKRRFRIPDWSPVQL
jgi:hypothetical protein